MKLIHKRKAQLTNAAFLIGALMMAPATSAATTASDPGSGQWRVAGQDLSNSRNQPAEHLIGAGNVKGAESTVDVHDGRRCLGHSDRRR